MKNKLKSIIYIKLLVFIIVLFSHAMDVSADYSYYINDYGFESSNVSANWTYYKSPSWLNIYGLQSSLWSSEGTKSYRIYATEDISWIDFPVKRGEIYTNQFYYFSSTAKNVTFDYNFTKYGLGDTKAIVSIFNFSLNEKIGFLPANSTKYSLNVSGTIPGYYRIYIKLLGDNQAIPGYGDLSVDNIIIYSNNTAPTTPTFTSDLTLNELNHTPAVIFTKADADGDAVTTYLYVSTSNPPTTEETFTTGTSASIGSITTLTDGQTYYVRARAWDGYEWSGYSAVDTFRMNSKPSTPVLSSPTEAQVILSFLVNLSWLNSTDAENDSITYDWQVNGTTQGTGLTSNKTSITLPEALHNWSVRAFDGYEYSSWTTVRTFLVELEPGFILAPSCIHGATWANCTWIDPPTNFHHLYIVNRTGSNNTWDSNVSAGVQFKNFTGLTKGIYNYSTQAVTPGGTKNNTIVWLNSSVNDYGFSFTNKSISESIINQNSGTEFITVSIHDNDGNITNATVTLTYFGLPFTYIMTNLSGETWSYNFKSGNSGAYTVTSFNATDDSGDSKGATWGQSFIVVPVSAGGSTGGGTEGNVQTTIIPTPTPGVKQTYTPATQINLPNIAQDPIGVLLLQGWLILGVVMVSLFFVRKNVRIGTPVAGVLIIIASSWTLGWWQ